MANQYVNKVVQSNGTTIMDITDTTATASDVLAGKYFYLANGQKAEGSATSSTAAISVVDTTDSHGGTIREITALDISDTTAVAGDVANGKYFYTAQGVKTAGTGSCGSTPLATAHTIYFEFSDNTNTTITVYYDDNFISSAITATTPLMYGQKYVTLAELDGVAWFEPANIPLNTELVDHTKIINDHALNSGGEVEEAQWYGVTDYTPIDPNMTFSFRASYWGSSAFYNSSRVFISSFTPYEMGLENENQIGSGTLGGNGISIPSNAAYIRLSTLNNADSSQASLIRLT